MVFYAPSADVRFSSEVFFCQWRFNPKHRHSIQHPLRSSEQILRPDHIAWTLVLDALAKEADQDNTRTAAQVQDIAGSGSLYELSWATEKFILHSHGLFSRDLPEKSVADLGARHMDMYSAVILKALSTWQQVFAARASLPANVQTEIQLVSLTLIGGGQ